MKQLGFIGLGTMGKGMALNLTRAGYPLAVHDIRPEPVQELVKVGAKAAGSPREVAENSEVVITIDGELKGKKPPLQITPLVAFCLPTVPPVRMPPLLSEGLFHRGAYQRFAPQSAVRFPSSHRVRISPDGRSW